MQTILITVAVLILLVILVAAGSLIWIMNKKISILEKYCSDLLNDLANIRYKISAANLIMKQADLRGGFESDDEVGSAFKIIQNCIETLNNESIGTASDYKEEESK